MQRKRVVAIVAISLGAALVAFGLVTLPVVRNLFGALEHQTEDWRIRNEGTIEVGADGMNVRAASSPIRLVLFDSLSVQSWPYLSPFPRAMLADLVDITSGLGARAIGLDVYLDRLYPELSRSDNGDARLRDAIERAGNVILVAPTEERGGARVILPPHEYFADVAAGIATADLPTAYETIRESYITVRAGDQLVPSLPLAMYAQAQQVDLDALLDSAEASGRLDIVGLPDAFRAVPARSGGTQSFPILFSGPPSIPGRNDGAFMAFSSADLLALGDFAPEEWFRDKVIIIGTGFHESDRFRTAFYDERRPEGDIYGWTYGPEIHASATENLLSGRYAVPFSAAGTFALALALALVVALVTFARQTSWGAVTSVLLVLGTAAFAVYAFAQSHILVPIVAPTLGIAFAFLGSTSYISVVEGRDKRMIRSAFGKFVSPAVVDQLVADPGKLKLGGEKRHISIIFSDLAGFTSLSESMEPEKLVAILNDYLDKMADIVLDEGGTLDKYIGDAIMALYGAPNALPDHAVRACRTALRMQRRLDVLNEEWKNIGLPHLAMRIGINTGTPVVGNIGGEKRFDYTALGDAVNLAARLEPACKTYGIDIMISNRTRVEAGDAIVAREVELLAVYGKSEPVPVYELIAMTGDDLDEKAELIEVYNKGLAAYRNRDFELALQYFKAAAEQYPEDGPSALYLERCREYIESPPPADWDFVERRQIK